MADEKKTAVGKQAKGKVSVTDQNGVESVTEEVVKEKQFIDPACNVGFSAGFTQNMGNYNSMRVQVSINVPCYVEEIEAIYEFTREWVDGKLDQIRNEMGE